MTVPVPLIWLDTQRIRKEINDGVCYKTSELVLLKGFLKEAALPIVRQTSLYSPIDFNNPSVANDPMRELIFEICSGTFLRTAEKALGETSLLPDPFLVGGGVFDAREDDRFQRKPPRKYGGLGAVLQVFFFFQRGEVVFDDASSVEVNPGDCLLLKIGVREVEEIKLVGDKEKSFFFSYCYKNA